MSIEFKCSCGLSLSAADVHKGLPAECPQCKNVVKIPGIFTGKIGLDADEERNAVIDSGNLPADKSAAAAKAGNIQMSPGMSGEPLKHDGLATAEIEKKPAWQSAICADCGDRVEPKQGMSCIYCRALHHAECWNAKGGCSVPTCVAGPKSRRKVVHIGEQEEKLRSCPVCAELIPERAHRCRYCGEFTDGQMRRAKRSRKYRRKKTSYLAGHCLIVAIISFLAIGIFDNTVLILPIGLMPIASFVLGILALKDINTSDGEKSGTWTAAIGMGLGFIALLAWLGAVGSYF